MEAKDTVMSDGQILQVLDELIASPVIIKSPERAIAKAQAEISFKAGQEDIREEMVEAVNVAQRNSIKVGKQAGIREVMEFYSSMGFAQIDSSYVKKKLQAKLKEWGIE